MEDKIEAEDEGIEEIEDEEAGEEGDAEEVNEDEANEEVDVEEDGEGKKEKESPIGEKQKKTSTRRFGQKRYGARAEGEFRLRLPRQGEMFALIKTISGGSRMILQCEDGKERMGRVIGKMRKRFWIRENDIVIIKPWEFATADDKAEIIWKYTPTQKSKLERQGRLTWLSAEEEEFEL